MYTAKHRLTLSSVCVCVCVLKHQEANRSQTRVMRNTVGEVSEHFSILKKGFVLVLTCRWRRYDAAAAHLTSNETSSAVFSSRSGLISLAPRWVTKPPQLIMSQFQKHEPTNLNRPPPPRQYLISVKLTHIFVFLVFSVCFASCCFFLLCFFFFNLPT